MSVKLGAVGATALRSINGSLQYISSERPDVYGKIPVSQESMNDIQNQTWQSVATANATVEEIKNTNATSKLWYPVMDSTPPLLVEYKF